MPADDCGVDVMMTQEQQSWGSGRFDGEVAHARLTPLGRARMTVVGTGVALVLGSLVTTVTMASRNDAAPVPATEEVGLNGRPNLITPGIPQNGPSPSKTSRPPVQEHEPELIPVAEQPRETRPTPTAKPSPTPSSKPPAQPSVQPWPGSSWSASDWQEYCQYGGCGYYGYYNGDPYGYSDGRHQNGYDGGGYGGR